MGGQVDEAIRSRSPFTLHSANCSPPQKTQGLLPRKTDKDMGMQAPGISRAGAPVESRRVQ